MLFTGEYPEGIRRFLVSAYRYALRVEAYVGFLTDRYPPFSLAAWAAASSTPLAMDAASQRDPRIAGDVTACSALVSCVLVSYAPCAEGAALICSGTASRRGLPMGVQLGFGVQLGGKVIWAGLLGCGCGAGTGEQQREAVPVLP